MRFLPILLMFVCWRESHIVGAFLTNPLQATICATITRQGSARCSSSTRVRMGWGWDEDEEDEDNEFMSSDAPEKSQMTDFIADFLKKTEQAETSSSSSSSSTMDNNLWGDDQVDNDEQSATTAADSTDRFTHLVAMPMDNCHELMLELESVQRAILYHCPVLVHACIQQAITRLPLLYVRTSGPSATSRLFSIVEDVMEDHLFQPEEEEEVEDPQVLNEYGTRPFTLNFNSLEIDGSKNEILQAVASTQDSDKLRVIVEDLQARIHKETGWETCLPPDPQADHFRARIPFMRLPDNWDDLLEKPQGSENDEFVFLPSEEGGNGISPIFWGKWVDDDFGTARMREVAVFKRSRQAKGLNEKAFYLPEKYLPLPEGNNAMTKQEAHFQDYQEQRMLEAEEIEADEALDENPQVRGISDDDTLLKMTKNRLEALYATETAAIDDATETTPATGPTKDKVDQEEASAKDDLVDRPTDPESLNDWTRDRIQSIVSSRAKVQSEKELAKPKDKPPIEENEVFRKYKEGTLATPPEAPAPAPKLPPFPSREHCVGFWKVIQSPTGFEVEQTDSSRSDNLVCRVDGTTAGGPLLDQTTRQKAAGGTWRLNGDDLRIRLIIPPGKERILVMQGTIELVSPQSDIQLAPSTFGIPALEARKARAAVEMEDTIYCNGKVWVEDAVTKENRVDIGTFSLMKINTFSEPGKFTITIPQPIRNQD